MGAGNCVIAKDTPENHEVLADAGLFFRNDAELAGQIRLTLADPSLVKRIGACAQDRAKARYSWDAVTDAYEELFRGLIRGRFYKCRNLEFPICNPEISMEAD